MDRFAMRFDLGYVTRDDEVEILNAQRDRHPLESLRPCLTTDDVRKIRHACASVRIAEELKRYIVDLVAATRHHAGVSMGASPRAGIMLMKCSQALALIEGSEFVTPDIIQQLAVPVIAHRLALDSDAEFSGNKDTQVVSDILSEIDVPV